MSPTVKFRLKEPKSEGPTLVILLFYLDGQRFVYSTGKKVLPNLWDDKRERPLYPLGPADQSRRNHINYLLRKYSGSYPTLKLDLQSTTRRLDNLTSEVARFMAKSEDERSKVDFDKLRSYLADQFNVDRHSVKERRRTRDSNDQLKISAIIKAYVKDITNGQRLTKKGKRFAPSTIKTIRNLISIWEEFEEKDKRIYKLEDISRDLSDALIEFMHSKLYSSNTTSKHLTNLKTILRDKITKVDDINFSNEKQGRPLLIADKTLHRIDRVLSRYFHVAEMETTEVALTEEELSKLYDMKLTGNKEKVRDIFLIGCYIGNRVGDYSRLGPEHYKRTLNGSRIKIRQTKTGRTVTVPVKPELEVLLSKYNYKVPKTTEQNINRTLKVIAKEAGICEMIEVVRSRGGKAVITVQPKYALVKSHTARRTLASILVSQGIPYTDCMVLTGHKSVKSFEKYLRVNKEDTLKRLASSDFFTGKRKKQHG